MCRKGGATYAKWGVALEDGAVLGVDLDLELLHALRAAGKQRGEQGSQLILDGKGGSLQRNLSVLDIGDAGWGSWDEFVSEALQRREGSTQEGQG